MAEENKETPEVPENKETVAEQVDEIAKIEIPSAKDPMGKEDAEKVAVLVRLDRAKLVTQRARFLAMAAKCDVAIAEQDQALADIERRVLGVTYPAPAEKAETESETASEEK